MLSIKKLNVIAADEHCGTAAAFGWCLAGKIAEICDRDVADFYVWSADGDAVCVFNGVFAASKYVITYRGHDLFYVFELKPLTFAFAFAGDTGYRFVEHALSAIDGLC